IRALSTVLGGGPGSRDPVGARHDADAQCEIDQLLLLPVVQRFVARSGRRGRIAASVYELLVRQHMAQQVMLYAVPGTLVARLFLAPDDFGRLLVALDLRL